jgi:prepilin-type N-terminal cleavage/methylation domain-containing protein
MKRVQQGFTLIELMIVIAIVAILVALAVPAYKDYTVRTKVAECINGAAVPKLAISEFYESMAAWPGTPTPPALLPQPVTANIALASPATKRALVHSASTSTKAQWAAAPRSNPR